mgnify:CR=1 FL=1
MADAVEAVVGSLEIIDSRIAEWRITLPDTIADNASYGAVIVGGFRVPLSTIEVTTLPVSLAVNGEVVARATGAAVPLPLPPFSTITATAIFGLSTGAKPTKSA